jgi:FO synthase
MHAVARLVVHPLSPNIQASWVKLSPRGAAAMLGAGVNDMGGTLMNEGISRAAGTQHGQELAPADMEQVIRSADWLPQQRTTLYGSVASDVVASSFACAPLQEPVLTPFVPKSTTRLSETANPVH